MSFPPATEMFQFAGFASCGYGFTARYPLPGGLPHSEIPGSKGARASPGLFAACHVLHRLSAPRHSPDALGSLAPLQQRAPKPGTLAGTKLPFRRLNRNDAFQNEHTMLKRSPTPDHQHPAAAEHRRTEPGELVRPSHPNAFPHPGRTRKTERRSIAMPAFDQTCLFTMSKEQPPRRRPHSGPHDRTKHVTRLSPAATIDAATGQSTRDDGGPGLT